jgi:hypothetical protein
LNQETQNILILPNFPRVSHKINIPGIKTKKDRISRTCLAVDAVARELFSGQIPDCRLERSVRGSREPGGHVLFDGFRLLGAD